MSENTKQVLCSRTNKVVYAQDTEVVKLFNARKPAADVFNEALNCARAAQAGIDVPEVEKVCKIDGSWALVTSFVEGKTLRTLLTEDPQKADEILARFVQLELDIHNHKAPLMNRQKDKLARMINDAHELLDETTRYELLMRLDGMPNHSKVLHGDFVLSNVIVRPDESLCVCDWAHATQGAAGADCATTYLHFMMRGEEDLAKRYLGCYCEASGVSEQYIQSWLPLVAAAELSRGRVAEYDFLLSWVGIADYQ